MSPQADQRITNEMLRDILRNALTGRAEQPSSAAIVNLAFYLNFFREQVKGWKGPWAQELEDNGRLGEAIWLLTELLPSHREHYVSDVAAAERCAGDPEFQALQKRAQKVAPELVDPNYMQTAKERLTAFDALVSAARMARDRGLPLTFNMAVTALAPPPATKWHELADNIERAFHNCLPNRSKASGYRFMVAVIPYITGEAPSFGAVEINSKRRR